MFVELSPKTQAPSSDDDDETWRNWGRSSNAGSTAVLPVPIPTSTELAAEVLTPNDEDDVEGNEHVWDLIATDIPSK